MATFEGTPTKKKKTVADDYADIATVCSGGASSSASVHGVVARLSPMKPGKKTNYYEGSLSDGNKGIRLFGFNEVQRKKLQKFKESKEPVNIIDCEIKKARGQPEKVELFVKQFTEITNSSMEFKVDDNIIVKEITLDVLPTIEDFETISLCNITVERSDLSTEVSGGLTKQDVYISDRKGVAKLTLWEEDVGKLEEGVSYKLTDIVVRSYNGTKYLSFSKGALATAIGEGEGVEDSRMNNCEIIGVISLNIYRGCLTCKQKILSTTEKFGRCTKCNMKQRLDHCKVYMSAKILLWNGELRKTLNASGKMITEIAEVDKDEVTEEALLLARPFSVTYKNSSIISIYRK